MIEVLFGESEAGSMKCAKSMKSLCRSDGPVSVIGNPPAHMLSPKEWIPVPGTPAEVIGLPFLLDIGDIQKPADSTYRLELIQSLHIENSWTDSEAFRESLKEEIHGYFQSYSRFLTLLKINKEVRIWYSYAPYSLCGLYWICSELAHADCTIHVVELPHHCEWKDHSLQRFRNWGEVSHDQFSSFLPLQKTLTETERALYAGFWTSLKEDNSPLRAVINGELTGVPEDFYDFFIRKELTETPVKEARLIGNILGKYPVFQNDLWYAARIEHMIRTGEIRVLEDSPKKYARVICRRHCKML